MTWNRLVIPCFDPGPRKIASTHSTRRTLICVGALLWLFPTQSAKANDTSIQFNNLPPDTPLSNQYTAMGVTFGYPPYSSLGQNSQIPYLTCCWPATTVAPPGNPNPIVVSISNPDAEFYQSAVFGTFTTFRQHMLVTVGDMRPNESAMVTLIGYDINGVVVAHSQEMLINAQAPTLMGITSSTSNIAFFLIQTFDYNKRLWIDNLTFDN